MSDTMAEVGLVDMTIPGVCSPDIFLLQALQTDRPPSNRLMSALLNAMNYISNMHICCQYIHRIQLNCTAIHGTRCV